MKFLILIISFLLFLAACSGETSQEKKTSKKSESQSNSLKVIRMSAWAIGPEKTSYTRISNLKEAVKEINESLESKGQKIQLETEFWTGKHQDYKRKFFNAFKIKAAPDILLFGHERIGNLSKKGFLLRLNDYIKQDKTGTFKDFYDSLWQSVSYRGGIYGIPQDTEVRMIYYRTDILEKMGWSKSKIKKFPKLVEQGKITLNDITRIGKEAQNKKLVKWGIYHRPTAGPNFFHFVMAFGGKIQDNRTGKLILDKTAVLKTLEYFYDLVHKYKVLPKEMTALSWSMMDRAIPRGEILFNITGGSWNKQEYIMEQKMPEEDFNTKVDFCLIPPAKKGGRPVTLSHPMVYVINRKSKNKDLAFKILTLASSAERNLKHALNSAHLAIRKKQARMKEYRKDPFLAKATEYLNYTRFVPNHPNYKAYEKALYEAIKKVEILHVQPKKALKEMISKLQKEIGDEIVYR